ncbi:MAG: wax ester/triacylglycerol synthase domain-containing protein [Mycobacteriaceae bacterium]
MRQLNSRDARWIHAENPKKPEGYLLAYLFADTASNAGHLNEKILCDWVEQRVAELPYLRQKLLRVPCSLDHPYWVNFPEINIKNQIQIHDLEAQSISMEDMLSSISTRPMDLSIAPWELHFLKNVSPLAAGFPERSVLVALKLHHAFADGLKAREIAERLFGPSGQPHIEYQSLPGPPNRRLYLLLGGAIKIFWQISKVGLLVTKFLIKKLKPTSEQSYLINPCPESVVSSVSGEFRTVGFAFFDRKELEQVKNSVGEVSVNDVAITIISMALSAYLHNEEMLPQESLLAAVPMSTRDLSNQNVGNSFVNLTVRLFTTEQDPIQRLRLIHSDLLAARKAARAQAVQQLEKIVDATPAVIIRAFAAAVRFLEAKQYGKAKVNTLITSVPRSPVNLEFFAKPAIACLGVPRRYSYDRLSHQINGYGTSLVISFSADTRLMASPSDYIQMLTGALTRLKNSQASSFGEVVSLPGENQE